MSKAKALSQTRQIHALRRLQKLAAEAHLTDANQRQADCQREAEDALENQLQARDEWQRFVQSSAFRPDYLGYYLQQLSERDACSNQAQDKLDKAIAVTAQKRAKFAETEALLKHANLKEKTALRDALKAEDERSQQDLEERVARRWSVK